MSRKDHTPVKDSLLTPGPKFTKSHDQKQKLKIVNDSVRTKQEKSKVVTKSLQLPGQRFHTAAVKVQAVVKFTKLERLKRRAKWATKKLIVFILSHVGLTVLVGLYAVAGGFIFQNLETNTTFVNNTHNNNETEEVLENLRWQFVERLFNMTYELNVIHPDSWKMHATSVLEAYEKQIRQILRNVTDKEDGQLSESNDWTYPRALLYALTIITTIGYGNTVPLTWEAKLVSMVYALFGIPLTLLCLANIGSLLASVYRLTWKHLTHIWLVIRRSPSRHDPKIETSQVRVPILVSLTTMVVYILGGAAIFSKWENWSFLDGSYFCFITLSTIGFGDFVPGKNRDTFESNTKRVVCALYLLFGLATLSMVFQLLQDSVSVVIGRYASVLGLSESKIRKDMEETTNDGSRTASTATKVNDRFLATVLEAPASAAADKNHQIKIGHTIQEPRVRDAPMV